MDQLLNVTGGLARAAFSVNEALDNSESLRNAREKIKAWQALDPFPYQPLPTPTSIRLIKLAPSKKMQKAEQRGKSLGGDADDDDDDIHFAMETAELERNPRFTALSYTWRQQRSAVRAWGRQTSSTIKQAFTEGIMRKEAPDFDDELAATRKVTCNRHKMQVFENLFAALKQLRRRSPGEWLWIDAVCINQSDNAEIDKQIQIMGQIYRSARLVVVWLGSCPRIVDKGLDILQAMAQSGEPLPEYPLWSKTNIVERAADDWRLHYAAFTALHLANRSWHKRVWVLQEVCLARQVIFLHGKHEINLATLSLSCKWCLDNRDRGEAANWFDIQTMLGTNLVSNMQFLPATLRAREEFVKGSKWTLLRWLQACRGRLASEEKDFVFAGLSLVREDYLSIDQKLQSSLAPKRLWPRLRPDSAALAAEVFLNATACLLSHETLEELLRMSSRLRDKHRFRTTTTVQPRELEAFSGLPSWVIAIGSWTCGLTADFVPEEAKVAEAPVVLENHGISAYAAGSRPSISADGRVLSIKAAIFDNIASAECETDVPPASEELRKLMRFLVRAKDIHAAANEPGDVSSDYHQPCLLEDVACAMVAGHIAGKQVTSSQTGPWLCESIQSRVSHLIAITQRQVTEDQRALESLELKAKKRGHGIDHLRHMPDPTADTVVMQWREKSDAIKQGLELIAGATAELEMLKTSYAHLRWPAKATVVSREEDMARAKTGREDSWKKRLEELSEQRSTESKSPSHFQGTMLDRAKINASDLFDTYNDWSYVRMSAPHEQFHRLVSDECSAFENASIEMLSWRKICLTRRGRVLLGPRWADDGDSIVLLPGVSTPFILTREKEDLVREDTRIRDRLSQINYRGKGYTLWAFYESQLKVRLVEVQSRLQVIAGQDEKCWLLVGEAYVQGRRHSDADTGLVFGRIDIA